MQLTYGEKGNTDTVGFDADEVTVSLQGQGEFVPFDVADLSGGLLAKKQYASWEQDRNRTFENEGVQVHNPGTALKGYASTVTTGVVSGDFSGSKAANLKVHHLQWPTSSGLRSIFGFASFIIKDTSASDPTPITPATADNVTDNIMAMWLGDVDGTLALFIGTDGTTDDVKYTTDPTADSITWTSAVTYSHANDVVYAGCYLEQFRRHVIWGVINQVAGVYSWKNDDTLPVTSSTMQPVVFTQDKDLEGDIATVTVSNTDPTVAANEGQGVTNGQVGVWKDVGNIFASDDSDAFYTIGQTASGTSEGLTSWLHAAGFDFSSVPLSAHLIGLELTLEHAQSTLGSNVHIAEVRINSQGSTVGQPRSGGDELGTSDSTDTLGATNDDWGTGGLVGSAIRDLGAQVRYTLSADSGSGGELITVDHVRITSLVYRFPGTQLPIFEGLHGKGSPLLSFPNIVPIIEPVSDDGTGITVRRRLAYYTFAVDADDRILCDVSRPYTGLPYVGLMSDHLGGLAVFGGADSSTWDQGVLVGPDASNRDVENLELPSTYGDADSVRVYGAFERQASSALFAGIHHGDNADAQTWIGRDGAWNPYGVLQSKSGTAIASAPIPFAMFNPTTHAYRFFPNSTTNLHVTHEFIDSDPYSDPRLVNSTQARHTGALRVQMAHLDMGRGDLLKTITALEVNSFEVDDGTAYSPISIEFDAGEDLTMASPDVDETFNAADEAYTRRDVASSGVQFDSGIVAVEFGTSSGAKTAQALPFTLYYAMGAEDDRIIECREVKPKTNLHHLLKQLEVLKRTKSAQPLFGSGLMDENDGDGVPCMFESLTLAQRPSGSAQPGQGTRAATLRFREIQGKSTS